MLHDDHLCLVESGKQQIKEVTGNSTGKLGNKSIKQIYFCTRAGSINTSISKIMTHIAITQLIKYTSYQLETSKAYNLQHQVCNKIKNTISVDFEGLYEHVLLFLLTG